MRSPCFRIVIIMCSICAVAASAVMAMASHGTFSSRSEKLVQRGGQYCVVVSEAANADPAWRAVADALAAKYSEPPFTSHVVVANPSEARAALQSGDAAKVPRYVAFVVKPEEAGAKAVSALHAAMKSLDADPYYDAVWGIVTGPTAEAAMRLVLAKPIHPRTALTTTGVDFAPYDSATTISDAYAPGSKREEYALPNRPVAIIEKRGGSQQTTRIVRGDTTAEFAAAWEALDPELLVTSGHASQRNLEMPFSTGNIVPRGGELMTLPDARLIDYSTGQAKADAAARAASVHLAAPTRDKVWIAAGNCLIGDYVDNDSMAAALIGYGRVVQFMGYVKTTWFGEIGWETLAQFAERDATTGEAWYFAGQNLERKLMRTPQNCVNFQGRMWDRDATAFWGDPALDARMEANRAPRNAKLTAWRDGEDIVLTLTALADISGAEDKVEDVHVVHPFGVLLPHAASAYACDCPQTISIVTGDDFALVTSWPEMKRGESISARLRVPGAMEVAPADRAAVSDAALARDVDFLTRWTPPQYLPVPGDFVTNNCILAEAARASAPETYPDEIFLDYVLPYSVIREDRDDWRAEFRTRFAPIVAGSTNAYEAAVALDRKIWDMIDVHYNTGRDQARQAPRHSMRIHMASCTGISIILIDACRALGIPARLVGCNWTTIAGNHSWVEVWSRGGWHVLASGEKESENDIWFLDYAEKADASRPDRCIYASRWSPSPEGTLFWQTWRHPQCLSDVPADDVTADYAPGGRAARN